MAIKLAANLSFLFKERAFLDRFEAAANAGFKAVEFGGEVPSSWSKEQLVIAKENAGVEVVGICAQLGGPGEKGLTSVPGREEDFRSSLKNAVEYALALKCPRIHFLAGVLDGADPQRDKAETTYVENLKYAAVECAKHNITVLIEPISVIPNYFLTHQQQAVDIIMKVGHPNVKIEFDTFHAQTNDGNLTEFIRNNFQHIGHIQISQVPGRHEPNEKGEINFPFLFDALQSLGYDGWIGCEYVPTGTTEDGLHWAKQYLHNS